MKKDLGIMFLVAFLIALNVVTAIKLIQARREAKLYRAVEWAVMDCRAARVESLIIEPTACTERIRAAVIGYLPTEGK